LPVPAVLEEETSVNSECSESHADHISSANSISARDAESIQIEYDAQQQYLEQVQREKTELEEWKREVGEAALDKVSKLSFQIEELQTNGQQLQFDMDGVQQENTALKQQIRTYLDEIEKLQKEQPKMQSQINDFEELLREQYMVTSSMSTQQTELSELKKEHECVKQSLKNANLELKTLRTENADMKCENERYQSLLDTLRTEEHTLKQQVSEQQEQIASLSERYKELNSHLQTETEETRKQLSEARHIARNLSDQLEEVTNLQNMNGAGGNLFAALQEDIEHEDDMAEEDTDAPIYGRSPLEKRRTLKICSAADKSLLKLPFLDESQRSASYSMFSDDEGMEGGQQFAYARTLQQHSFTALKMSHRRSSLPPVSEFRDDDMDARTECEFDEKHVAPPIIVKTGLNHHCARTWALMKRRHSDSTVLMKDTTLPNDRESEEDDEVDDDGTAVCQYATRVDRRDSAISSVTLHSMHMAVHGSTDDDGDDSVEMVLRRICSSYPKHGVMTSMDAAQRHLLRYVVQRVRDEQLGIANEDKQQMVIHYEQELKQLQNKYKALKRAHKKRKAVDAQQQQRTSDFAMSGCKFWTWSIGSNNKGATAKTEETHGE